MRKAVILLAGLLVAVGVGWTAIAHAEGNVQTGPEVLVPAGITMDQTLYAAGQSIDIAGTVNGDVYCAGQSVTISGRVNGDVLCAGQDMNISGVVNGSLRAAGQTIVVSGQIQRNTSVAGQTIAFDSGSRTEGDATIAGQDVTLDGSIGRDMTVGGTNVTINGNIGRDLRTQSSQLTLGSHSVVTGNIRYTSFNALSRASGSVVGGAVVRQEPVAQADHPIVLTSLAAWGFAFALYLFAAFLLVSLVLVLLFPQIIHATTEVAVREPLKTFVVGLLASIAVPVIIFVLLISVIGSPLALLASLAWLLMMLLAVPLVAYYLGSLLLSKSTNNPVWMMLLGTVIIALLYLIPFIGFVVWLLATWMGLGMILLQVPRLPKPRYVIK